MCEDLEESNKRGDIRRVYQTVRTLTGKFRPQLTCVKSKTDEEITKKEEVAERWKEYCEELYDGEDAYKIMGEHAKEPAPLRSEIERAINESARRKSAGPDEVPAELFKFAGDTAIDRMHRICVEVWETGEWPEDWTKSIFIPIPKNGDMKQCRNYRTIALVSHASKIMLKIILERIRRRTESELTDVQAGFRRGKGTRDQVTNLRIIMEKMREHQLPLYMCFVDFKKAFDCVSHEQLWLSMVEMGYPAHIINLITELYRKQTAKVKIAGILSSEFRIRRGVRQGCVISPTLFNILSEMVMREALKGYKGGIHVGGRRITNLRYADDIVLMASTEAELQDLVTRLDREGQKKGLEINMSKTKCMALSGNQCNIKVQDSKIEQVETFVYLGSLITEDAESSREIRIRTARGLGIGVDLMKLWKSHNIKINTKLKIMRTLIWPVMMYGCESWTIKKRDEERIKAFEMKCIRKILGISWIEKKTNEWVLETAGVERNLLESIKRRKMSYFGHIMRKQGDCLEKEIMQGTVPGARARGKPRKRWMDNMSEWSGLSTERLLRETEDRRGWRGIVHNVKIGRASCRERV